MIRYCWILPDLSFSGSWGEDDNDIDDKTMKIAREKGYRLLKYEVIGEDFEIPQDSILITKPK